MAAQQVTRVAGPSLVKMLTDESDDPLQTILQAIADPPSHHSHPVDRIDVSMCAVMYRVLSMMSTSNAMAKIRRHHFTLPTARCDNASGNGKKRTLARNRN